MTEPTVFISYSWTTPDHERWVLNLAERLAESGVLPRIDKYDLQPGHDAFQFMERSVRDTPKVILVCDQRYAEKADARKGGSGTEAQIISPQIYQSSGEQEKFVAVLAERGPQGEALVPTFYSSRIYIDLSDEARYEAEYERLVRWIFGKPLDVRPPLGKPPSYVLEEPALRLGTSSAAKRCVDALKNHRSYASAAIEEYASTLIGGLELLQIPVPDAVKDKQYDEVVIESIEQFSPYLSEATELFVTVARYGHGDDCARRIHRLIEKMFPFLDRPWQINTWDERQFDNYRFIVHELFLRALGSFVDEERFDDAALLLNQGYYAETNSGSGKPSMLSFASIWRQTPSLAQRSQRMQRTSARADLLKSRCGDVLRFSSMMQADFVAFLHAHLHEPKSYWFPETLMYATHSSALPVFARCQSKRYFEKAKSLLGIEKMDQLIALFHSLMQDRRGLPQWSYHRLNPAELAGATQLCSKP